MTNSPTTLRAGALTAQFENGALRYVRYGDHEVIRSLYFALRDQNWGTVPFRIDALRSEVGPASFAITFAAVHAQNNQDVFRWDVTLTGSPDSAITFQITGRALQPFWRNRAGFCLLHPVAECAGQPVTLTQPDGHVVEAQFPVQIAPHRPFPYLTAMQWPLTSNVAATEVATTEVATTEVAATEVAASAPADRDVVARVDFSGDEFETEDHRNWTDTSYKTFCTPLSRPFPVELRPGDLVEQSVRLSLLGNVVAPAGAPAADVPVRVTALPESRPLPCIGTQQPFGREPLSEPVVALLRALQLDHYRVDIDLDAPDWPTHLTDGYAQARAIGAALLVALTVGSDPAAQLSAFRNVVAERAIAVRDVLLFGKNTYATPAHLLRHVVAPGDASPGDASPLRADPMSQPWRLGAGTPTNYAELGRNPFAPDGLDVVAYGIQPQEHAFDDASLVENLESQADTVRSARALYPGLAVYVSPLTLKKRFNPYANQPSEHFTEQPLAVQRDERQTTDFGAGWLLGSLASLASGGANAVTVFRAAGPLGLVDTDGTPYPAYHALRAVQAFAGGQVRLTASGDKLRATALLLERDGRRRWLLVNHTAGPLRVQPDDAPAPITLRPHEYRILDRT